MAQAREAFDDVMWSDGGLRSRVGFLIPNNVGIQSICQVRKFVALEPINALSCDDLEFGGEATKNEGGAEP